MKKPRRIKKALETIAGFCDKHESCEDCCLSDFCENTKYLIPCHWGDEQEGEGEGGDA